jgi:hypothetical protein
MNPASNAYEFLEAAIKMECNVQKWVFSIILTSLLIQMFLHLSYTKPLQTSFQIKRDHCLSLINSFQTTALTTLRRSWRFLYKNYQCNQINLHEWEINLTD